MENGDEWVPFLYCMLALRERRIPQNAASWEESSGKKFISFLEQVAPQITLLVGLPISNFL